MVADFVSVEYGWMHSHNGKKKTAQVLFQAEKAWEGNFNNDNIHMHLSKAAKILKHVDKIK